MSLSYLRDLQVAPPWALRLVIPPCITTSSYHQPKLKLTLEVTSFPGHMGLGTRVLQSWTITIAGFKIATLKLVASKWSHSQRSAAVIET